MALRNPQDYDGASFSLTFQKFNEQDHLLTITKYFFSPWEREGFIRFLRYTPGFYKILDHSNPIIQPGLR